MARQSILHDREAVSRAVREGGSIREALEILGLKPAGGNYQAFHRACTRFGIELPVYQPAPRTGGRPRPTKISWPDDRELRRMVAGSSFAAAARVLGVSDTAVRKRLRAAPSRLPVSNGSPALYKRAALPDELRRHAGFNWFPLMIAVLAVAGLAAGRALTLAVLDGAGSGLAVAAGACLLVLLAAAA